MKAWRAQRNSDRALLATMPDANWQECRDPLSICNVRKAKSCCELALLESDDRQGKEEPEGQHGP